ncbi:glycoside hydrolase superfamily [Tricladium varicosporioides]|nr:glycoside hydrolase superfamily [Hymenoscyphus varicosporioides]
MLSWFLLACALAQTSLAADFNVGQKFQIILSGQPNTNVALTPDAAVWDIDLMTDNADVAIANMKDAGKIVICYFSAGTVESYRQDANKFTNADKGKVLPEWPNEKWVNLKSANVRSIMKARIQMAKDRGCDAIDPDNVDAYQNDNGLGLTKQDSVDFMKYLASTAAGMGMKTGLKNALAIISDVQSVVSFAVNEQCAQYNECTAYHNFIAAGKPVFHIEYPAKTPAAGQNPSFTAAERNTICKAAAGFSTVLKAIGLDGWVMYCDGSTANTNCTPGTITRRPPTRTQTATSTTSTTAAPTSPTSTEVTTTTSDEVTPTPTDEPTTAKPTTIKTTTTSKPASKTTTSTSKKPTTTSNGGGNNGGCTQKHWDQCGGNDWKGCTVCAAGFQCKGVSPPWYYQCL